MRDVSGTVIVYYFSKGLVVLTDESVNITADMQICTVYEKAPNNIITNRLAMGYITRELSVRVRLSRSIYREFCKVSAGADKKMLN